MSSQPSRILGILGLGDLSGKGFRAHFSFWSMVAMTFFLFGDQNLTSSNLQRIGADFGMPDKEQYLFWIGSVVSICFFVIGGAVSIFAGVLTDQWDRKKLLLLTVIIGELPCLLTAFAPNYAWFLVFRTLTGIGLGGIFPIIFSLLGDYFKQENRSTAAAWLGLAMGLGIAVGQVLSGALAHSEILGMTGWRASFVIMAAPAFPLALLYAIIGTTPRRGGSEAVVADDEPKHTVTVQDFKRVFSTKTNIYAILQGIPGCVPWGLLFTYMVNFYEQTKGFHVQQANLLVISFGGFAILGAFLGGFVGKALYNKNKRMLPLFCFGVIVIGCIPTLFMVNFTRKTPVVTETAYSAVVKPGMTNYFRVSAVGTAGESDLTSVLSTKPRASEPGLPEWVAVQTLQKAVELTWAAVPDAVEYRVFSGRSESMDEKSENFTVKEPRSLHQGLKEETEYYFKICAVLKDGTCKQTNVFGAIPQSPRKGVPQGLKLTHQNGGISLQWSASDAREYKIYQSTTDIAEIMAALIFAVIAGLIVPMVSANIRAILINTNLPENRGSVFAVFNLADDLGKGLGPFFVGVLVLMMPQTLAYNVAVLFWLPCAFFWLLMAKSMIEDENRVNETLARRART